MYDGYSMVIHAADSALINVLLASNMLAAANLLPPVNVFEPVVAGIAPLSFTLYSITEIMLDHKELTIPASVLEAGLKVICDMLLPNDKFALSP